MCGVVGIVATNEVNQTIFDALTVLQHRGQDAAGMMTCENNHFALRKGNGLVKRAGDERLFLHDLFFVMLIDEDFS